MLHPKIRNALNGLSLPTTLTPVYPAGEGITQTWLRKRISRALLDVEIKDLIPLEILKELKLPPLAEALRYIHHPPVGASLSALDERTDPAWLRLKFDELVAQQIALRHSRALKALYRAPQIAPNQHPVTDKLLKNYLFSHPSTSESV